MKSLSILCTFISLLLNFASTVSSTLLLSRCSAMTQIRSSMLALRKPKPMEIRFCPEEHSVGATKIERNFIKKHDSKSLMTQEMIDIRGGADLFLWEGSDFLSKIKMAPITQLLYKIWAYLWYVRERIFFFENESFFSAILIYTFLILVNLRYLLPISHLNFCTFSGLE